MIAMENPDTAKMNGLSHRGRSGTLAERYAMLRASDSVLVLYGTVSGNAELLAEKFAKKLCQTGIAADVRDMALCQPQMLREAPCVLMVVSTHGDGEPPENAAFFYEALVRGKRLDLRGVNFSVLALGNSTFDRFCKCGRDLDAGATRRYAFLPARRLRCRLRRAGEALDRWRADQVVAREGRHCLTESIGGSSCCP